MSRNPLHDEACRLAALGHRVFPLRARSKKPIPKTHGVLEASADLDAVRAWWTKCPESNIGLACGAGMFVVDIDPPAIAVAADGWIDDLQRQFADAPWARTPRGGLHFFCRSPEGLDVRNSASKIAMGVDVRGGGGYVVVAPSRISDGKIDGVYAWERSLDRPAAELPDAPDWILDALRKAIDRPKPTHAPLPLASAVGLERRISAARRYLAKCDPAIQGNGGHAKLFNAARILVRGFDLDDASAFALLVNEFNPRCDPPWAGAELDREFRHKLREAREQPFDKPVGWLLTDASQRSQRVASDVDLSGILSGGAAAQTRTTSEEPIEDAPSPGAPDLVQMSSVPPERIRWVWPNRIPAGKLSILAGDPGLGKSFMALDMIARVSSGALWPDDSGRAPIGSAIILSGEDGLGDTLRPRLDQLDADCSRVFALRGVHRGGGETRPITVQDVESLRAAIEQAGDCRLVMVDPVSCYLGDIDAHRDTEVREALAGLEQVAQDTGAAILGVMHLAKSDASRKAVYRLMGSLAFTAAPRAVWSVSADPDDKDLRVLTCVKMNIAQPAAPWGYRVDDGGLHWEESAYQPASGDDDGERDSESAIDRAIAYLRHSLRDGPLSAGTIEIRGKSAGHSKRTLARAKSQAGICSRKGTDGVWRWFLPDAEGEGKDATDPTPDTLGTLGTLGILAPGAPKNADSPTKLGILEAPFGTLDRPPWHR